MLLQKDIDISTSALAKTLHVLRAPCGRRINRANGLGVIQEPFTVLDREALG